MYIKLDNKKLLEFLAVMVFVWYAFTVGWEGKIWPGMEIYLNKFLYIVANLILLYFGRKIVRFRDVIIPISMALVVCLFNNANNRNNNEMMTWSICACLVFYCVGANTNSWHKYFMNLLIAVGSFYSFCTILSMLVPSFFLNVCIPFFSHYGYASKMLTIYQRGYITGFTPHYSTNAMYLAVTLGSVLAYAFEYKFKNMRINALTIVIFASVLFTGKRAHSIFILAAVMILYLTINSDKPLKRWGKLLVVTVVALVILTIAAQFVPQLLNVVYRFIEAEEAGDIELGRGDFRALAIEIWHQHPFFGMGWDSFKYYYRELTGTFVNVHCVYVQLLCEVGIVGALPFYIFFVTSLIKAILLLKRMTFDQEENFNKHLVVTYSVYVQIFFLLYCLTGNPLYDNPTLFTYLIGCCMSEYYWINMRESKLK